MATPTTTIKGKGSKIYYGNTGSEANTALARVRSINPPQSEAGDIELTHLESDDREYTGGIKDNGEAECVFEMNKTTYDTLDALVGVDKAFKILYVDGSKSLWEGYIKRLGKNPIEIDSVLLVTMTIKISGAVTFTPAP